MLEREPARACAVLTGQLTVDGLFNGVITALRRHASANGRLQGPIAVALEEAATSELPWSDRLEVLRDGIFEHLPMLVVLDNFEDNLERDDGEKSSRSGPRGAARKMDRGSSIEPPANHLPAPLRPFRSAESDLAFKSVGPLSAAETSKLIWSLPALDRLSPAEAEQVWRLVGGHPRSLEYLDAFLSGGSGRYPDITRRLKQALNARLDATKMSALLGAEWKLDDAIAEVATIAADDVLLDQLLAGLTASDGAEDLLLGMSVYREPTDINAVLFQVGTADDRASNASERAEAFSRIEARLQAAGIAPSGPNDPDHLPTEVRAEIQPDVEVALKTPPKPPRTPPGGLASTIEACADSSLLGVTEMPAGMRLFVHRWTASELQKRVNAADQGERVKTAHLRAGEYWEWRVAVWPQGPWADIQNLLEARHHYLTAGLVDRVVGITESVCSQLDDWGAWDDEAALISEHLPIDYLPTRPRKRNGYGSSATLPLATGASARRSRSTAAHWQSTSSFSISTESRTVSISSGLSLTSAVTMTPLKISTAARLRSRKCRTIRRA